jgi:hypothetical protein
MRFEPGLQQRRGRFRLLRVRAERDERREHDHVRTRQIDRVLRAGGMHLEPGV